jgi:hypothetical protein
VAVYYPDDVEQAARQAQRVLDATEEMLEEAVARATKHMLRRMLDEIEGSLLADVGPLDPSRRREREAVGMTFFQLGAVRNFWEEGVDEFVIGAVREAFDRGRRSVIDDPATVTSLDRTGEYLANVKDRLSRTAEPPIPDQAFDTVRKVAAQEISAGTTTERMAARFAEELKWEGPSAQHLRGRRALLEARIEARLESAEFEGISRTVARKTDPTIRLLQDERTDVVKQQDADKSIWQTRAERIARTETTGAYNAGAHAAQMEADVGARMWVATPDAATRETHLEMNGTCVKVGEAFQFPDGEVMFPGDPSGPAAETINCRCTTVAGRSCADLQSKFVELGVQEEFDRFEREKIAEAAQEDLRERLNRIRDEYPRDRSHRDCVELWRETGLNERQIEILGDRVFHTGTYRNLNRPTPDELAMLPQNVPLPGPSHTIGLDNFGSGSEERIGAGTFVIREGMMVYVENGAVVEHLSQNADLAESLLDPSSLDYFTDPADALEGIFAAYQQAMPANFFEAVGESPNPRVYYKAGAADRDAMAVAGESINIRGQVWNADQTMVMFGAGLGLDKDSFINHYTLTHEVAHGIAGTVNASAPRRAEEAIRAVREEFESLIPEGIREGIKEAQAELIKDPGFPTTPGMLVRGVYGMTAFEQEGALRKYQELREDDYLERIKTDPKFAASAQEAYRSVYPDEPEVAIHDEAGNWLGEQVASDNKLYLWAGRLAEAEWNEYVVDGGYEYNDEVQLAVQSANDRNYIGNPGSAAPAPGWGDAARVDTDRRWALEQAAGSIKVRHQNQTPPAEDQTEIEGYEVPTDFTIIEPKDAMHAAREIDRDVVVKPAMTPQEEHALRTNAFIPTSPYAERLTTRPESQWGFGERRPAVTKYGASREDYIEDFAEAYTAWWGGLTDPDFGYSALTGDPLGFEDLYPERDAYFRDLFSYLGVDVPPTPERPRPTDPWLYRESHYADRVDTEDMYRHQRVDIERGIILAEDPLNEEYLTNVAGGPQDTALIDRLEQRGRFN